MPYLLSMVEMTTGLGAALGAALGGWLFYLGDFLLPMLVGAALPLCVLPLVGAALPSGSEGVAVDREVAEAAGGDGEEEGAIGPPSAARKCASFATCASLFFSAVVFEGLNPLLEPHLKLRPYGLSVTQVGVLLACICIVYTLTALPTGWLTDRCNKSAAGAGCRLRAIMLSGWALTFLAAVLLAPGGGGGDGGGDSGGDGGGDGGGGVAGDSDGLGGGDRQGDGVGFADALRALPALSSSAAHWALWLAVPALGAGAALVIIPSLPDMQRGLGAAESAAACALWNGAYAGGSALGPLASVMLFERRGWQAIVLAQAAVAIGSSFMLVSVAALPSTAAREYGT